GADTITVSQSGTTFTIVANGNVSEVTGNFAELAIHGGSGNNAITVQSSVNITCLLYGGAGADTLTALGSTKHYNVTLRGGTDTLQGNGTNTSFWADSGDIVVASDLESKLGDVHRITSFYQPWTNSPNNPKYVSTNLNGPNLLDPTDSGTTTNFNYSLWGN